ncbi:MAG TPA: hypothetical protein VFO26_15485 [Gaiella sp.]|uniref:hypothetical protein n=1 Tax=Gaiella sp. TaxID=2663207 RepID=UPI002D7EB406|nr:hypothetical protein [Gaiella sp.]HET9288956.1 hypothetical protein [Gaiella sp.]
MGDASDVHGQGAQLGEAFDNPLERLRLLSGDDDAIATFLDELDVQSPREREMLAELARASVLARPDRFDEDHRRAIEALESLRRHGFHGSQAGAGLGPFRLVVRWLVQLVARYLVVSYVKEVSTTLRNLYWMREMEAAPDSRELKLLRPARFDANYLVEIMRSREIGVPSFVIAGLLIPLGASIWRLMTGFTFDDWWVALVIGLVGVAIGVGLSWIVLRGSALASTRIRLAVREPLQAVWDSVGHCGRPPKDGTRKFAIIAIVLMVGVWVVFPAIVALALAV